MQLLSTSNKSLSKPQLAVLLDTPLNQNTKITQTKLSMIWVSEFDGERNRLIAKWIKN
ncbi:hypothetical protein IQ274_28845 [Nostoc sp. LEGE 12447]|uniref:hypothetical protein n=1 Tax=Nostoc sp. LEGE 12447 TaxID=1828640 RepID=UPI001884316E|nr:hypothetical protein [Nostoc sp. LEGE 12447]MBE9002103.1 hypothetical protein [Nostoc sp. LEGE 12447]